MAYYCLGCSKSQAKEQPPLLVCSACKCVYFCGRECQQKMWKGIHKPVCRAIATAAAASSSSPQCMVIDGMNPLGPNDFLTEAITTKTALGHADIPHIVLHAQENRKSAAQVGMVLTKLTSLKACIILGWGSGSEVLAREFGKSVAFREALVPWVSKGGLLFVHGERTRICGPWPAWFDFPWSDGDYLRSAYAGNPNHWAASWWYDRPTPPRVWNVKACALSHVAPGDILFGTDEDSRTISMVPFMSNQEMTAGQSPFVLARFGEGVVSFFGDVNAEDATMNIISIILTHYMDERQS